MWVGVVDQPVAKAVMDLCDSTCVGTPAPRRQYGQLYSFVRELRHACDLARWDDDHRLKNCVALSRLVHPTGIGFKYAARVKVRNDSVPLEICRAEVQGIDVLAYPSPSELRKWLTEADALDLRSLISSFRTAKLPERVHSALFYHEFASRTWYADIRWTLVCTALEALLNDGKRDNKNQFRRRASQLADELGLTFREGEAGTAYDVRSKLTHGEAFLHALPQAEIKLYDRMESLLRACLRRCIEDDSFAQVFANEQSICSRWPRCW